MSIPDAPPARATVALHLTIELPQSGTAATAIRDIVDTIRAVPGAAVSTVTPAIPEPRESIEDGDRLRIDPRSRRVVRCDRPVPLTRLEFDLLHFLCAYPGQVHRRDTLMAQVWGTEPVGASRTIDVHIRRLRVKLGPDGDLIATVRGIGYRFDGAHRVAIEPVGSVR